MNKLIVTLAILGAISVMLYQVVDWSKVGDEYAPVVDAYNKVVDMIPSDAEVIEAVDDKVTTIEATPKVVKYKSVHGTMPLDPDSPEISNSNYSWLKNEVDRMAYPEVKDDLREALANDGVIRENEYSTITHRSVDYAESQDQGAKRELKQLLNE